LLSRATIAGAAMSKACVAIPPAIDRFCFGFALLRQPARLLSSEINIAAKGENR